MQACLRYDSIFTVNYAHVKQRDSGPGSRVRKSKPSTCMSWIILYIAFLLLLAKFYLHLGYKVVLLLQLNPYCGKTIKSI